METVKLFLSKIAFAQSANPILYNKLYNFAEYGLILFLVLSIVASIRKGDFLILISALSGFAIGFIVTYYGKTIFSVISTIIKFIYGVIAWIIKYLIWSWLQYIVLAINWLWNILIWSWLKYVFLAIGWLIKTLIWSWLKYIFIAILWVWNKLIWIWLKYVLFVVIVIGATIYYTVCIILDLLQTRAGRKGSFLASFIIGIFGGLVFLFSHSLLLYLFIVGILIGSLGYLQAIFSRREFSFFFHTGEIFKNILEGIAKGALETATAE